MDELCQLMQHKKIPIFLSTLVSNERGLKPFISAPGKSGSADELFNLANAAYAAGNYPIAKRQYDKARDLDLLRFRAPEAINQEIVALTKKYSDVHLVDTKQEFEQHSPHGILGSETILEHVHPNLYGYALLSDAFYQSIKKADLIKAQADKEMPLDMLLKEMPVTKVDSLNGVYTIMMLETGWPFNKPIPADFNRGTTIEEQLAGALAVGKMSWLDAINMLFQYSVKANDKKTALKAVEAVMLEYPQNTTYQIYAGRLSFEVGDYDKSVYYFKLLYDNDPTLENTQDMYLVLLKTDQPEKALKYIDDAAQLKGNSQQLESLKTIVNEIIQLKAQLAASPGSKDIGGHIAMDYRKIGADEAANKYQRVAAP